MTIQRLPLRRLVQTIDNGAWGDKPASNDVDQACVRAADFDYEHLRVSLERIPTRSYPSAAARRLGLAPGDIILEKSGGGEHQPVGRAVLWTHAAAAVPTNFAARLRPTSGVDPRYLVYVLAGLHFSGATIKCIRQTTGIQNLDTNAWLSLEVRCRPLEDQRRIAEFLDDEVALLDAATTTARAALERAEERAAAAVHAAVTGQGFDQRQESPLPWARSLPSHWSAVKLGLVARMGTGHTPSRSDESLWVSCTIPWLTTNDVHRFRRDELDVLDQPALSISEQGLAQSAAVLHPAATVALSRTASAGYSVLMGRDMATSQDFVTWRCGPRLRPSYLLAVLRASRSDLLGRLAMGSTHKTIYFPDLEAIRVPLPPLEDQDTAINSVAIAFDRIRGIRREVGDLLNLLKERKQALITACVNGEVDVTSAAWRPRC